MIYETVYGENIAKILNAYPPGHLQIKALEILVKTAEERALQRARVEIAQTVCEGLHEGTSSGLKCMGCYQAEQNYATQLTIEAEIATAKAMKETPETPGE